MSEQQCTTKTCTKCGKVYLATTEFFHRQAHCKDGLRPDCKECSKKRAHKYYAQNAPRLVEYAKNRRVEDPERFHAEQKANRKRNADAIRERNRNYRATNPDKVRGFERKYQSSSKGKARAHRRYAREHNLPCTLTSEEWETALIHFNHKCAVCGRSNGLWHKIVPDHWIPLSDPREDNPGTVMWNIVPMCNGNGGCNTSKRHEDAKHWLIRRLGKRKGEKKFKEIAAYLASCRKG